MREEIHHNFLDKYFADFLVNRSGLKDEKQKKSLATVVADLSAALAGGNSCLPVDDTVVALLQSVPSLVSDNERTPLVRVGNLLYLQRYYLYECLLASQLTTMAGASRSPNEEVLELLEKLFEKQQDETPDLQKAAAELALRKRLCIVSGGPGTGKTTTIVKILALLIKQGGLHLSIAMAAPTGKAAMRLRQSVVSSLEGIDLDQDIKEKIPVETFTLHRLLGTKPESIHFRHNRENPLKWDVVIVDEASMVDLALMAKLVDALKENAHLVLVGDKDQLASVESGAVLSHCIESLPQNTVILEKTYRFDDTIRRFAKAIIANDFSMASELLLSRQAENVSMLANDFNDFLLPKIDAYMTCVKEKKSDSLAEIFDQLNSFQVLCCTKRGRGSVEHVNSVVEQYLRINGYIERNESWYPGKPVMVTSNDYNLGLFNGDVGVCAEDVNSGQLKVWFAHPDGGYRGLQLHLLPQHETVYAMTVHKSQGSEFGEVLFMLPDDDSSRILCRELIYTAVTRAKKKVVVYGREEVLEKAMARRVVRHGGLIKMLGEQDGK